MAVQYIMIRNLFCPKKNGLDLKDLSATIRCVLTLYAFKNIKCMEDRWCKKLPLQKFEEQL